MRRKLLYSLLFSLLATLGVAQTVTITGTVLDPNGQPYANGNGRTVLVPQNQNWLFGNNPVPTPIVISGLDSFGRFSVNVTNTSLISPQSATPQWQFSFCSQAITINPVCFTMTPMPLTTSQDISTQIQAQSAPLPFQSIGNVVGTANQISVNIAGFPPVATVALANPAITPGPFDFQLTNKTVATLPAAAGSIGRVYRVTDGQTASDCTLGGGASSSVCYSNGTTWVTLGGGGGNPATPIGAPQYNNNNSFASVPNTAVAAAFNWSETLSAANFPALTGGSPGTVTLVPCPVGVDTSAAIVLGGPLGGYMVYIQDGANSESVWVTSGTCTSGGASGTIVFTPFFSHTAGAYTVRSATSGAQEAVNQTCGTFTTLVYRNTNCEVHIPAVGPWTGGGGTIAGQIDFWGTLYWHTSESTLYCDGATIAVHAVVRGPAIVIGDLTNSNDYGNNTIKGCKFRPPDATTTAEFAGSLITTTVRTSGVVTITTSAAHNFRNNDRVNIQATDYTQLWGDVPQITVTGANTFTYPRAGAADLASISSPGIVALSYEAILDNAQSTHYIDVQHEKTNAVGRFNHFFDIWDDENTIIEGYNNSAINMQASTNWTGSNLYASPSGNLPALAQQIAAVITFRDSNITANGSNCFTDENSNGLYVINVVCQATGPWQAKVSNAAGNGNFLGASFLNLYSESTGNLNSVGNSPWGGLGFSGLIAGQSTGAASFTLRGNGDFNGGVFTNGTGATEYCYFVVVHDVTAGTVTAPLPAVCFKQSATQTNVVNWPRVANGSDTITYDLLRVPANNGMSSGAGGFVAPYTAICTGGAPGTCGSVVTAQAQVAGFVQTFSDNTVNNTTSYTVAAPSFNANLNFWPGQAVMTSTPLLSDRDMIAVGVDFPSGQPNQISMLCTNGLNVAGSFSTCLHGNAGGPISYSTGMILQDVGSNPAGVIAKGKLVFSQYSGTNVLIYPHDIITLVDSNIFKTTRTTGYRPASDAADTGFGIDNAAGVSPSSAGLAVFASISISNYINTTRTGSEWLERITSSLKSFKVPINTTSYLDIQEIANPGNPAATTCRIYDDSTTHLITFLNSAGANCFGAGVTGSASATQVAVFTAATVLGGNADFLYVSGSPNKLTIPGGGSCTGAQEIASGTNNTGFTFNTGVMCLFANNNVASGINLNFYRWTGAAYQLNMQMLTNSAGFTIQAQEANNPIFLTGNQTTTGNTANLVFGSAGNQTATSGLQAFAYYKGNFAPTSGTATFMGQYVNPIINQTGGANGTVTILGVYPVNTAIGGTEFLLALGTATTQTLTSPTLTNKFTVDSNGNQALVGNIAFTSGKGQHFNTQASNNDTAGVCSGTTTTCSVTFTTNYTSTPSCVVTPTTSGVTSAIITSQANSGFTVTYAPSGTTNFNYVCIGDPN